MMSDLDGSEAPTGLRTCHEMSNTDSGDAVTRNAVWLVSVRSVIGGSTPRTGPRIREAMSDIDIAFRAPTAEGCGVRCMLGLACEGAMRGVLCAERADGGATDFVHPVGTTPLPVSPVPSPYRPAYSLRNARY